MFKNIIINCIAFLCLADQKQASKNLISVIIPDTSETETLEMRSHQTAQVRVFLSSLGDPLDTYMVSLIDTNHQSKIDNLISDASGEVIFKKVPAGTYAVYLNRKVKDEEQENSTVKISDLIIKAYP